MMKSKRLLATVATAVFTIGMLAGCGNTSADSSGQKDGSEKKVTINISLNQAGYLALLDRELKFSDEIFKDDNVEINYTMFENGPAILEALEGGSVDIVPAIGELPAITSKAAGRDIEAILAVSNTNASAVAVLEDSEITQTSELKGKKIGVSFGTVSHYVIIQKLAEAGLSEEDVELVNLGTADSYTAIVAGEIDALVVGKGESISDKVKFISDFYYNIEYTLVRGEFAEEHPDFVAKYLAVLQTAGNYVKEHPEESAKIVAEASGRSEETLLATFEAGVYDDILNEVSDANRKATEGLIEFAYEQDLSTSTFSADDFFFDSYAEDAKKYLP